MREHSDTWGVCCMTCVGIWGRREWASYRCCYAEQRHRIQVEYGTVPYRRLCPRPVPSFFILCGSRLSGSQVISTTLRSKVLLVLERHEHGNIVLTYINITATVHLSFVYNTGHHRKYWLLIVINQ